MPRFPGCPFGPMQLRHALRPGRERGERLIGWCLVRPAMDFASTLLLLATGMLPYIGMFGAVLVHRRSRLMVLTDRRIILVPLDKEVLKPKNVGNVTVLDLGVAEVSDPRCHRAYLGSGKTFTLSGPALPRPVRFTLAWDEKRRAVRRLVKGLAMLASDTG